MAGPLLSLSPKGADVAISGRRHMEGAIAVADEIKTMGRKAVAVQVDLRQYEEVKNGFARIKEELGPVSIVVNNAALMNHNISIAKTSIEEWDDQAQGLPQFGLLLHQRSLGRHVRQEMGQGDQHHLRRRRAGGYGQSSYGAAKAGLISLAKTVALKVPGIISPAIVSSSGSLRPMPIIRFPRPYGQD